MTLPAGRTVCAFFGTDSFFQSVVLTALSSQVWSHEPIFYLWLWFDAKTRLFATKYHQAFDWNILPTLFLFHCSTNLGHSFLVSKFSVNKRCTALFQMPPVSASSCSFIPRSSNTISWIFFTISGVVTSFGRPLRCSSWQTFGFCEEQSWWKFVFNVFSICGMNICCLDVRGELYHIITNLTIVKFMWSYSN